VESAAESANGEKTYIAGWRSRACGQCRETPPHDWRNGVFNQKILADNIDDIDQTTFLASIQTVARMLLSILNSTELDIRLETMSASVATSVVSRNIRLSAVLPNGRIWFGSHFRCVDYR
jgi:hypothetical protein